MTSADPDAPQRAFQWAWRFTANVFTVTALMFLILNMGAGLWLYFQGQDETPNAAFKHAFKLAYPELTEEERERLQLESSHSFQPAVFAQPREESLEGEFVRVARAGYRYGGNQAEWPPEETDFVVFIFGGSTAFGYGVRDSDTIASYLQEELARLIPAEKVAVYNFARGGYYSTQERVQFDELLTVGPHPDLAVFIDGLNEFSLPDEPPAFTEYYTIAAAQDLAAPHVAALRNLPIFRILNPDFRERSFAHHVMKDGVAAAVVSVEEQSENVVNRYLANIAVIRSLGAAYGVVTAFVWQPIPVYGYDLEYHPAWSGHIGDKHRAGYATMQARTQAQSDFGIIWCADIQVGVEKPLYVDHVHYNPLMSHLLANCIADELRDSGALAEAAQVSVSPFRRAGIGAS